MCRYLTYISSCLFLGRYKRQNHINNSKHALTPDYTALQVSDLILRLSLRWLGIGLLSSPSHNSTVTGRRRIFVFSRLQLPLCQAVTRSVNLSLKLAGDTRESVTHTLDTSLTSITWFSLSWAWKPGSASFFSKLAFGAGSRNFGSASGSRLARVWRSNGKAMTWVRKPREVTTAAGIMERILVIVWRLSLPEKVVPWGLR